MKNKHNQFTKGELDFIEYCANKEWNDAHYQLTETKSLGDIERQMLEKSKVKAKELLDKIENGNFVSETISNESSILEAIGKYEQTHNCKEVSVLIDKSGAGICYDDQDLMLFTFNTYNELIEKLYDK